MTKTFPDGVVELGTGSDQPPGWTGQQVATNYTWFRVNGGEWERSSGRSMHRNVQALEWADSVDEFRQYLEII